FRRLEVDRLDLEQREVALRVLRRPYLARYGVARAEGESSDLGRSDVNVVGPGQVVVVGSSQKAEAIRKDFQNTRSEDEAVFLRLRLEDLEDQLLLGQGAPCLDVQGTGDPVPVR